MEYYVHSSSELGSPIIITPPVHDMITVYYYVKGR